MSEHTVNLVATEGIFVGLAKQNMVFHQCIGELVDNSIAANIDKQKFKIEIVFSQKQGDDFVDLYISDNSNGMDIDTLKQALQLGESATKDNRLNEHGFGLKNALATLSNGNRFWKLWTKPKNVNNVYSVEGPFKSQMTIKDDDKFPQEEFLTTADISTLIKVQVRLTFLRTLQGRGAPANDLASLRDWLIEHLGVMYRGFLEQDRETNENSGTINVSIGSNSIRVPPVQVPLGNMKTEYFEIELGGKVYNLEYRYGTLDPVKRDTAISGTKKAKYYYQKNQPRQGIDIRLGKRVIATSQFETIWKTENGESQLQRHNNYNDFLGELIIPDLPRGVLSTTNNKTDFNLDDSDWEKIFSQLNKIRPPIQIREKTEKGLKDQWITMLRATNPNDTVTEETTVWPTGTRIDVYRRSVNGDIIIYELKVGSGEPIHLYQLKMYWDGLVMNGEQPKEAILLVESFSSNLEEMANLMNTHTPPINKNPSLNSNPYIFKIEKHADKNLK